jgi:cyclopropane-fatty-acyl-phospholipid synthase
MDPVRLASDLFASPSRSFAVSLWNGLVLAPAQDGGVRGRLALVRPSALDALLPPVLEHRLSDAYLDGDFELEGDAIGLLEAAARWEGPRVRATIVTAAMRSWLRRLLPAGRGPIEARLRGRTHSLARDRDAVRHHYDLSNGFYRLFLDPAMVYSCGYFASGGETLAQAQRAKLELVCRKLHLAPGERLLDVGCGWGALLAYAAVRHGVDGLGITLSENQLAVARRRLARLRGRRLEAAAADYRTLDPGEPFDKVASVGMMEHVGRARLDEYFRAIHRLVRPGGLFLNHAIADSASGVTTLPWAGRGRGGFIDRAIFPDSELLPVGEVVTAAERAGFEVRDLESLREHYAETLAAWLRRLEARYGEAEALVGRRRARAYRLYLASSAAAFRIGRISVFQLLLSRRTESGRAEGVPRCRAAWNEQALGAPPRERARRAGRLG